MKVNGRLREVRGGTIKFLDPLYETDSINHGLKVIHVSGLKFACQLTSNVGGLECSQPLLNRDQPRMS